MSNKTFIKICGITRPEDAQAISHAGADAIGLVFWPSSRRLVSITQAADIIREISPFVCIIGLFLNQPLADVIHISQSLPLHLLQFHGDESPAYLSIFKRPYMKAFKAQAQYSSRLLTFTPDPQQYYQQQRLDNLHSLMLDSGHGGGQPLDWQALAQTLQALPRAHIFRHYPCTLAGGLTPKNVGTAIHTLRHLQKNLKTPWIQAVDISSGVESAPGIKCIDKVQAFIQAVRKADQDHKKTSCQDL